MVINPLLFSICESTRSYDHSPDRKSSTGIPINPCVKGMVFPGYGNPKPVPVPGHTRDPILTVLPIPLAFLTDHQGVVTLTIYILDYNWLSLYHLVT